MPAVPVAQAQHEVAIPVGLPVETKGEVSPGTHYATPWRRVESAVLGPRVVIEAGLHGDEIAGILAVDDLSRRLEVQSGSLVFLPRMNRPACDRGERSMHRDLNHAFPGDSGAAEYEPRLAADLMAWMGEQGADVVITLHESRYLHDGKNPKTFGQTVVYGVRPMPEIVARVVERANRSALEARERFLPNYFPIATSSTEQFVAAYGMLGLCLETWRGFALETRIRRQEDFVLALLDELGVRYGFAATEIPWGKP